VTAAVRLIAPCVAVTVTTVRFSTSFVLMLSTALDAPAGTVNVAGTGTTLLLLDDSFTTKPPAGAGPVSDMVRRVVCSPSTLDGLNAMLSSCEPVTTTGAFTISVAVVDPPPALAVMVAVLSGATTALVDIVNVAVECPAKTGTVAGTVAKEESDTSVTVVSPTAVPLSGERDGLQRRLDG
jgi:hypothetical protein